MEQFSIKNQKPLRKSNLWLGIISVLLIVVSIFLFLLNNNFFSIEPTIEIKPLNKYTETIRVLSDFDYKPYSFKDENGDKNGRSIELITEIANRMHVNLNIHFTDWQTSLKDINNDTADIVLTCEATSSVNNKFNLISSIPTVRDSFVFFSKKRIKNLSELYDMKIAVVFEANSKDLIIYNGLYENCIEFPTTTEAIEATLNGRCDCFVSRYATAMEMLSRKGINELKPTISLGISYVSICCKKDNEQLMKRINEAIISMIKDGTLDKINHKWINEFITYYDIKRGIWEFLPYILLFTGCIGLLFMCHNYRRNKNIEELKTAIINMTQDSETFILVDLDNNSYTNYTESEEYGRAVVKNEKSGDNFFKDMRELLPKTVHPDDIENVSYKFDENRIKENAKNGDFSFELEYRLKLNNNWNWYKLKATIKSNDKKKTLTVAVYNINDTKRNKLIFDDISSLYEAIYLVNLETNLFNVIKSSPMFSDSLKTSYTTAMNKFAVNMNQESYAGFIKLSDPNYIAELLMECEKKEFVFQLQGNKELSRRYNYNVLERDVNNKPRTVLLSVISINKDNVTNFEGSNENKAV